MFLRLLRLFLIFSNIILPSHLQALAVGPLPVDQLIKEADGIIIGHYLRSKHVRLEDGSLATQVIFKMNLEYGIQSEFFGMEDVIVHYPGRKLVGEDAKIEGTPDFITGESVVLMIKNGHERFWGLSGGLGTYKLINYGKNKVLINSIFPDHSELGQIKLEEFEKLVREIKGTGLKLVYSLDHLEEISLKKRERLPASHSSEDSSIVASGQKMKEENMASTGTNNLWLLVTLACMGGLFRLYKKRSINHSDFVGKL